MNKFEIALEEAYTDLEDDIEYLIDFFIDAGELQELKEAFDLTDEELQELEEQLKKHVDSKGKITKRLSRDVRKRRATQTTGRSTSERKRSARKATRTKKRNPGGSRRAKRKRTRALKKRKQMGIK